MAWPPDARQENPMPYTRTTIRRAAKAALETMRDELENGYPEFVGIDFTVPMTEYVAARIPARPCSATRGSSLAVIQLILGAMASGRTEIDDLAVKNLSEIDTESLYQMVTDGLNLVTNPKVCDHPISGDNVVCGNPADPGHDHCPICEENDLLMAITGLRQQYVITGYSANGPVPESRQITNNHVDARRRAEAMFGTWQGAPRQQIIAASVEWATYRDQVTGLGERRSLRLCTFTGQHWISQIETDLEPQRPEHLVDARTGVYLGNPSEI